MRYFRISVALLMGLLLSSVGQAQTVRQLVHVEGVRENQLVGYGLVVGLSGSGDGPRARYAGQSLANLLKQFGVNMPDNTQLRSRNVAAVMVSAIFPPGYRKGQTIDVTVSSLGDARSLRGGTLLLTPLRGANGDTYALAQGNLVLAGWQADGRSGSRVSVNMTTAGRIPNGATIEQEIASDFSSHEMVRLSLKRPNFSTANNIVDAINQHFGARTATALDATSVEVNAPLDPGTRVAFMARMQGLSVQAGSEPPRAVFNSRTGTVVISQGMTVRPAAVSHGALRVTIAEQPEVSQPNPFGAGRTAVVPRTDIRGGQDAAPMLAWPPGVDLQTIVDTINSTGATPDDVMAILQALDEAGALNGELVVI